MDLQVEATAEAVGYLEEIASEMVMLFPITMDEAIVRINNHFGARQLLTPMAVSQLLHEEQDVWAKHVYFGRKSFWWVDEQSAAPKPLE